MKHFFSWNDFKSWVEEHYGEKLYAGVGISVRKNGNFFLRSVDNTYYYNDDLENPQHCFYTLYGKTGDQDIHEKRYNAPFLEKSKNIYLYRVKYITSTQKEYIWYGKYRLDGIIIEEQHPDEEGKMRTIFLVGLEKV